MFAVRPRFLDVHSWRLRIRDVRHGFSEGISLHRSFSTTHCRTDICHIVKLLLKLSPIVYSRPFCIASAVAEKALRQQQQRQKNAPEAKSLPRWVRNEQDRRMCEAESLEQLLQIANLGGLSPRQNIHLVGELCKHKAKMLNSLLPNQTAPPDLLADRRFQKVYVNILQNASATTSGDLLYLLRSLLYLGVPCTDPLIEKLRANLNESLLSVLPLETVVPFAAFLAPYAAYQVSGLSDTQRMLEKFILDRLALISDPKLLLLLNKHAFLSKEQIKAIEDKLQTLLDKLGADVYLVLTYAVKTRSHNESLINAALMKLIWLPDLLPLRLIADILAAIDQLGVADRCLELLRRLSQDACVELKKTPDLSRNTFTSLCWSLSALRFSNTKLLDSLSVWTKDHLQQNPVIVISLLIACGKLNYRPAFMDLFLAFLRERFQANQTLVSFQMLLDLNVALAILNSSTAEFVAVSLSSESVSALTDDKTMPNYKRQMNRRKLLNLFTALDLDCNAAVKEESLASRTAIFDSLELNPTSEQLRGTKLLMEALAKLLPSVQNARENLHLPEGYFANVFVISDETSNRVLSSLNPKTLSSTAVDSSRKLVLLMWTAKDYVLGTKTLLGSNQLAVRHLKAAGYILIELNQASFEKEAPSNRPIILQQTISDSFARDS